LAKPQQVYNKLYKRNTQQIEVTEFGRLQAAQQNNPQQIEAMEFGPLQQAVQQIHNKTT